MHTDFFYPRRKSWWGHWKHKTTCTRVGFHSTEKEETQCCCFSVTPVTRAGCVYGWMRRGARGTAWLCETCVCVQSCLNMLVCLLVWHIHIYMHTSRHTVDNRSADAFKERETEGRVHGLVPFHFILFFLQFVLEGANGCLCEVMGLA